MKIYNTLTKQKEDFKPITGGKALVYSCGPTVYNYIHIGNARPLCVFDVLRRFLKSKGFDVTYVQNFTDVDDKIIRRSIEENIPSSEVSEKYIAEYKKDADGLNILEADIQPKVTDNMGIIIDLVKKLVDKGFAYAVADKDGDGNASENSDVYFRTEKFKEYGKLSHMPLDELQAGARVEVNSVKESPVDFALWKAAKKDEPFWESPWGKGRPGWHIECSAMVLNFLGETIDIHCGGQDLIFPHHENEIAQSEAATGKPLANYWMHNGYINVDDKKMSKSEGNFFTVREVAEKYGYEPIRFLMLQAHYRSPINYSVELIESCKTSLERLYTCRESVERAFAVAQDKDLCKTFKAVLDNHKEEFLAALNDDLNTADAISVLFELTRSLNTLILDATESKKTIAEGIKLFDEMTDILGLVYNRADSNGVELPLEILDLIEERNKARLDKDFAKADVIRDKLLELGYIIEETRHGCSIKKVAVQ